MGEPPAARDQTTMDQETIDRLRQGLEAYFAADAVEELLEAVDVDALVEGENLEEVMAYDRMGEIVGQLAGRLLVRRVTQGSQAGQAVEEFVGYEVGGRLGSVLAAAVFEAERRGDLFERVRSLASGEGVDEIADAVDRLVEEMDRAIEEGAALNESEFDSEDAVDIDIEDGEEE